jgi:hypothetical protein
MCAGVELNGKTYLKFVRKLKTADRSFTDVCISDDQVYQVIYALGQVPPNLFHVPASSLEIIPEAARSTATFYKPDELKYHGGGDGAVFPGRDVLGSGLIKLTANQDPLSQASHTCTPSPEDLFDCVINLGVGGMKMYYKKVASGGVQQR